MTLRQTHGPSHKVFLSFLAAAFAGCSGGDGTGGVETAPLPPPSTIGANFSEIQSSVFTPSCATSGCHLGAGAPQGLRLDPANSYALLVGVASSEDPAVLRVAIDDPANSFLIQKLDGTASVGGQMPLNGPALDQSVVDIIRQWITAGAVDDRASSDSPIRVTSLSPLPGTDLSSTPDDIVVMFDRELDTSTVNANTFVLEASGGDTTFGDGNETRISAVSITTPATTPTSATFDLTGVGLSDDTYRVRVLGSGASVILDIDANALDGELSGSFPSGDGTAGGDFEASFSLTTAVMGPTLDDIQTSIFSTTCADCHGGPTSGSLPSGMDLSSADVSFTSLVGVSSIQQPALSRITAGDPDSSYLLQKLEGTAATGAQMPAGGPPLDQAVIDDIRQWISDGASR